MILFNNIMMKMSDIYVSIIRYIFKDNNINRCRESIQRSMLPLPVFNDISIYTYQKNIAVVSVRRWCIYNPYI